MKKNQFFVPSTITTFTFVNRTVTSTAQLIQHLFLNLQEYIVAAVQPNVWLSTDRFLLRSGPVRSNLMFLTGPFVSFAAVQTVRGKYQRQLRFVSPRIRNNDGAVKNPIQKYSDFLRGGPNRVRTQTSVMNMFN